MYHNEYLIPSQAKGGNSLLDLLELPDLTEFLIVKIPVVVDLSLGCRNFGLSMKHE